MNNKIKAKSFIYFTKIMLILSAINVAGVLFVRKEKIDSEIDKIKALELHENRIIGKTINSNFKSIISDLYIIAENNLLKSYKKGNSDIKRQIDQFLLRISQEKKYYDQLRFIDTSGQEICRINFNENKPEIVSQDKLQNKKDRYYFKEAIQLQERQIYISPLDLNIENKKIELPFKPMIRFGTPLFSVNGEKIGVIIQNYKAKELLQEIKEQHYHSNPKKEQLFLVNKEGFWINHDTASYNWNFMFPSKANISFKNYYKKEWEHMKRVEKDQFQSSNGFFTYSTIHIQYNCNNSNQKFNNDPVWKLISYIPHSQIDDLKKEITNEYIYIVFLLFILSLGLSLSMTNTFHKKAKHGIELEEINKELIDSNNKLKTAFKEIATLAGRLRKSDETKNKFFSILAHDLRAPLGGFVAILETLLKNPDSKKREIMLQEIYRVSKNIYDLFENLLTWSRAQIKQIKFEPAKHNLSDIAHNVIELLYVNSNKKSISLENEIATDIIVEADSNMLKAILRNILSNAIKFTPYGGNVQLTASLIESNKIKVSVIDNGIGMSEEEIDGLFDIEIHTTNIGTDSEKGTGLGLIICKEFVEKHGGKIWAESVLGSGTSMNFTLPLAA